MGAGITVNIANNHTHSFKSKERYAKKNSIEWGATPQTPQAGEDVRSPLRGDRLRQRLTLFVTPASRKMNGLTAVHFRLTGWLIAHNGLFVCPKSRSVYEQPSAYGQFVPCTPKLHFLQEAKMSTRDKTFVAQAPAIATEVCGPPSHPFLGFSLAMDCALAFAGRHVHVTPRAPPSPTASKTTSMHVGSDGGRSKASIRFACRSLLRKASLRYAILRGASAALRWFARFARLR